MEGLIDIGINVSCCTINCISYVFDHKTKTLFKFEEIGSFIWNEVDGRKTVDDLLNICYQTFEATKEEIDDSVSEFILELFNKNLIIFIN